MEDIKSIKQDIYHRAKKEYESFLNDLKKLPKKYSNMPMKLL